MSSSEATISKKKKSGESTPAPDGDHRKRLFKFVLNCNHQANKNPLGAAIEPPSRVLIVIPPSAWYVFISYFSSSYVDNQRKIVR